MKTKKRGLRWTPLLVASVLVLVPSGIGPFAGADAGSAATVRAENENPAAQIHRIQAEIEKLNEGIGKLQTLPDAPDPRQRRTQLIEGALQRRQELTDQLAQLRGTMARMTAASQAAAAQQGPGAPLTQQPPAPAGNGQQARLTGNVVESVRVPRSDVPTRRPLEGVRVLIGVGFNAAVVGGARQLQYGAIVADVTTDRDGNFTATVPPGTYDVFLSKNSHVPRGQRGLTVAAGEARNLGRLDLNRVTSEYGNRADLGPLQLSQVASPAAGAPAEPEPASVRRGAPVHIGGRWTGTFVIQEIPDAEGCAPEILQQLEALKGKPMGLTFNIQLANNVAGQITLQITPPPGSGIQAGEPQTQPYRYQDGTITVEGKGDGGDMGMQMQGTFTRAAKGWTLNGSWQASEHDSGKRVTMMTGTWSRTNPNAK